MANYSKFLLRMIVGRIYDLIMRSVAYAVDMIKSNTLEKIYVASTIKPKDRSDNVFVYNYYIYHGQNWFIRIIPRFIHRACFS